MSDDDFVRVKHEKTKIFDHSKVDNEYIRAEKHHEVTKCNQLLTILQSVYQTQAKKNYSYRIGVATIFLVSAFVTVMLSVTSLTSTIFLGMG